MTEPINSILFPNYNLIHSLASRTANFGRASGGILLALSKNIKHKILSNTNFWIIVELKETFMNAEKILLCVTYIPPNPANDQTLNELFKTLDYYQSSTQNNDLTCLIGDLNARVASFNNITLPLIHDRDIDNFFNLSTKRKSKDKLINSRGRKLLEILENNSMYIVNGRSHSDKAGELTFLSPTGSSLIDLAIINLPNTNIDLEILNYTGSDHFPLNLRIETNKNRNNHTNPLHNLLNSEDTIKLKWDPTKSEKYTESFINTHSETDDINKIQTSLKNTLHQASQSSGMTQQHSFNNTNNQPWFDRDCRILRELTLSYLQDFRKHNNESYRNKYITAQKEYKNLIKTKKQQHIIQLNNEILKTKDASAFWSAINKFRSKQPNQINATISQLFAHYKATFSSNETNHATKDSISIEYKDTLLDSIISFTELEFHLKKLKNNKAPGPDKIPNEFIKNSPQHYKINILKLFNKILETHTFPKEWCTSHIYPIHKSGSTSDPKNYPSSQQLVNFLHQFSPQGSHPGVNRTKQSQRNKQPFRQTKAVLITFLHSMP